MGRMAGRQLVGRSRAGLVPSGRRAAPGVQRDAHGGVMNPTSLLYWYPQVKGLVRTPQTIIVRVDNRDAEEMLDQGLGAELEAACRRAADAIGYPLFLRTDLISGKHSYLRTCKVPTPDELMPHVGAVLEDHALHLWLDGPEGNVNGLVFRELLPLSAVFTAFHGLPIAPERRYFIRDGEVVCHHPYWIDVDNIESGRPSVEDWRDLLEAVNFEKLSEREKLRRLSEKVSAVLDGAWSVDWALANGDWYLIDMAVAHRSWHPEDCPHYEAMRQPIQQAEEAR